MLRSLRLFVRNALYSATLLGFISCPLPAEEAPAAGAPQAAPGPAAPPSANTPSATSAAAGTPDEEYFEMLKLFVDTFDQVERNYVKDVSRRELMEAAIQGMLSKLDQYSDYIPPKELDRFRRDVESEFGGIGIQINQDRGELVVISPIYGTPAFRAGLLAGDRITEIEGASTKNFDVDEAVRRLKGPAGSSVTITVFHPQSGTSETLTLKREVVRIDTVLGDHRKGDGVWDYMLDAEKQIAYIRITGFGRHTAEDLKGVLDELAKNGLRGLILDLRFNPGGLLSAAIEVSDLFISQGRIVSTEGRTVARRTWEAHPEGTFEGFPMVVLVNRFSASASEIVAACLQDHQRASIIGERTWGKGSVQNIIELENGKSALKLTTAGYQRPSGTNIHRFEGAGEKEDWGVRPDKELEIRLSDADMTRLLLERREREILRKAEPGTEPPQPYLDPQLEKALTLLRDKLQPAETAPAPAPAPAPAADSPASPVTEPSGESP